MADGEKNKKPQGSSEERFKYIGFDVYPGKAGDMFKSDTERQTWVEKVKAKLARSQGEVRDRCTLMESRLSGLEKAFLTLAAVAMLAGLFIPWFSGYIPVSYSELGSFGDHDIYFASKDDQGGINDLARALKQKHDRQYAASLVAAKNEAAAIPAPQEPAEEAVAVDSAAVPGEAAGVAVDNVISGAEQPQDQPAETREAYSEEIKVIFINSPGIDQIHGLNDLNKYVVALFSYNARTGRENLVYGTDGAVRALPQEMTTLAQVNDSISVAVTDSMKAAATARLAKGDSTVKIDEIFYAGPVLITDKTVPELASKGVVNDNYSVTGIGALLSLGAYGSMIFSSGIILVITGILLIVYFILCVVLAALNLYLLYGPRKRSADEYDLYLKKMLRFNWIPIFLWLIMFIVSFFGASYGFDSSEMLAQIGDSYGVATFVGLSSFGIYITLMGFIILALKGKEI